MTKRIHNTPSYRATVGIIEVVNEPQTSRDKGGMPQAEKDTLTQKYYPQALAAVRNAENSLGISDDQRLHVQFMDSQWGAGNPKSNLPSDSKIIFDDHNYVGGAVTFRSTSSGSSLSRDSMRRPTAGSSGHGGHNSMTHDGITVTWSTSNGFRPPRQD